MQGITRDFQMIIDDISHYESQQESCFHSCEFLGFFSFINLNCTSLTGDCLFCLKSRKSDGNVNLGQTIKEDHLK